MHPPDLSPSAQDVVIKMVGENIDRVVSVELRSYGVVPRVYAAARAEVGYPLSMAAARLLAERVRPGGTVLVLTGFPVMPYELPETDGPGGAAAIARTLNLAFDVLPVLVAEEAFLPCIRAACRAAGLNVWDSVEQVRGKRAVVVAPFTRQLDQARCMAESLVDNLDPSAVVAVERVGRNRLGEHHSGRGVRLSHLTARLDYVFEVALERGIATVGIGDLGNELGLGSLRHTVEQVTVYGARCECPCQAGMACDVRSDVPVVAGVSEWGAYGVCAALAYLLADPDLLHSAAIEEDILHACAAAGAIDGPTGRPIPWVDGIETSYHTRLVEQLHDLIRSPARLYGLYRSAYERSAEIDSALRPPPRPRLHEPHAPSSSRTRPPITTTSCGQ